MSPEPGAPLELESLRPLDGGTEALIRVSSPKWLRTSTYPSLAEETLRLLPGLARHRCESDSPRGIVAELADTETPHLVEHIALELLALAGWPRETRGRTRWDFERDGKGVFRVWLACDDAQAARAALEGAVEIATGLLGGEGLGLEIEGLVESIGPPAGRDYTR